VTDKGLELLIQARAAAGREPLIQSEAVYRLLAACLDSNKPRKASPPETDPNKAN
jgi:hypothetical protein